MALEESALRVRLTLKFDRVGDGVRPDAVVVESILELQRVLVHPGSWRPPAGARVERFLAWGMDGCGLPVQEATSSLSSSGAVVSVPLSAFSSTPPSSGGCSGPVADGSVHETSEKAVCC